MFYLFYLIGGMMVGLFAWAITEGNAKYRFTRAQAGAIGAASAFLLGTLGHANLFLALFGAAVVMVAAYATLGRRRLRRH